MGSEILASQKQNAGISFDPRTKLAVLITLVVLVLGGSFQTNMFYIPAAAPLIVLLLTKMWKSSVVYFVTYVGLYSLVEIVSISSINQSQISGNQRHPRGVGVTEPTINSSSRIYTG